MYRRLAFQFLYRTNLKKFKSIEKEPLTIEANGQKYTATKYHHFGKRYLGTIVLIHGFSIFGLQDERMDIVSKGLANIGFNVVWVGFQSIIDLKIDPDTSMEIADVAAKIADELPEGKVSILTPSLSAGLSITASTLPKAREKVAAICSIGTFSSIRIVLKNVFLEPQDDGYARNVLYKNYLHYYTGNNPELEGCYNTTIQDFGHNRPPNERHLPAYLKTISKENVEFYTRLGNDLDFRTEVYNAVLSKMPDIENYLDRFEILDMVTDIDAAVCLIHGKKDHVIPAEQSVILANELKKHNKSYYLELTSLISHGDLQYGPSVVIDAWQLAKAFAYFFKKAHIA